MAKPDVTFALNLRPEEAIRYFESKGLKLTKSWNELWQDAQVTSFTVAHVGKMDVLADIHAGLRDALHDGITEHEFMKRLTPILQAKGWWGKAIDKSTGEILETYPGSSVPVQYGSPARLKLIYQQNLQTAYMAGRYRAMEEGAWATPYWQYVAVMDSRTRPAHSSLNGRVWRHDDPIWSTLYPPNGWNCRCRISPMSKKSAERKGLQIEDSADKLETRTVPAGRNPDGSQRYADVTGIKTGRYDDNGQEIVMFPDAGWSYNPGKAWAESQAEYATAKLDSLSGITPREAFEYVSKITQAIGETRISKFKGVDPDLLKDMFHLLKTNLYILQLRPGILGEIRQGGIAGSAALKHEMEEVRQIEKGGRSVFSPGAVAAIEQEFDNAVALGNPAKYIPYHMAALLAELEYARDKLAPLGFKTDDLGVVARAIYGNLQGTGLEKMEIELAELGYQWPGNIPPELEAAIRKR
ncbi:phage minor head protein [Thiothrix lacustris]|uniref:phage head morphogenesis protein n=1 Tax=Thiothrix lacustris TaxID=525917 RepID=UPI00068764E1|nr:phage minor head protein [Thiothrix lacustris]